MKSKPRKNTAKKITKPKRAAATARKKKEKLAGKITHYFSHIKVAVIKVLLPIKQGDAIRIVGGEDTDFEQQVASMQVDHEKVILAKKGNSVGLKIKKKVHEGYKVYKI